MSTVAARIGDTGATVAAFFRRDVLTAVSYRLPFVLDVAASVFQVALFFFLSQIVEQDSLTGAAGLSAGYFSFVVVGLVMLRIIDTALRSLSDKLRTEQAMGTFEVLLTTPTPLTTLILGSAGYTMVYGTASGGVMFAFAGLVGVRLDVSFTSALAAAAGFVAALAFFAALGVAVAAFVVVFKHGSGVLGMVTHVLGLLGGAYVPVTIFPAPLQLLARANPMTWALDVLRGALLTDAVLWPQLASLACAAALLLHTSIGLLRVAIDRARSMGTLAQY